MSRLSRSRRLVWALVAAQSILLAVLATLQYRWTEDVSRALAERMRSAMESAAKRFAEDFDRELTRAFLHFLPEGPGLAEDLGEAYAGLLQSWRRTAPVPALVEEVYQVQRGDDGLSVGRLMPQEARFADVGWPSELDALRRRLENWPDPAGWGGGRGPSPWLLAPEIPALIVPLADPSAFRGPPGPVFRAAVRSWVLLRLDLDYLRSELLPQLTDRYFAGDGDFDFEVEVVVAESRARLYRSDPQPAERSAASDLEIGMFGFLRDDHLRRLLFDTRLAGPFGGPGRRGFGRFGRRPPGPHGWPPGFPPDGGPPDGTPEGRTPDGRSPEGRTPDGRTPEADATGGERGGWRLLVRHREGSLEAAVDRFRRRHLAVGFGVLALLALTVTMLLAASRRAQRLAAQQVEFVAGITHELRTPITAVRSLGQNLADGVAADPDRVRRYGALIERQGSRLSRLVEQVLELSGILSGRKAWILERSEIAVIVEAAVADCRPLAEENGARLEVEIARDLPAVAADAEALARAVANLIANAVKYGAGGGEEPWVGVRVGSRATSRGGEVTIEVADRGPGIPREDLPQVFEPFYRGRNATADQLPGAGLGLSLVRRIAEAHGGRVEVRSGAGRGSVFTLRLPALGNDDGERKDPDR
jgi:signal transduction histidine kinase